MTRLGVRRRLRLAARVLLADTPFFPARPTRSAVADEDGEDASAEVTTAVPAGPILDISACTMCGGEERTLVSEFNRFLLSDEPPDAAALRYDYSLCHACGAVYATKRPAGERYRWLFHHFEETLGRIPWANAIGKLTLSTFELSDAEKAELRRRAARGIFVSEHQGLSRKEYLPFLSADRLANSAHVELLGSVLDLRAPRVLEIRSRAGSIGAALKLLYCADAYAMALFENQRFVIEETYGIPTSLLDFEDFSVPHAGPFDLVVSNHMLTHAVRPRAFLAAVRERLRQGGHLYLYNEPDDAEYLTDGKSMFSTLNAFHLQTFDAKSLVRALAANGFTVTYLTRFGGHFMCVSRLDGEPSPQPPMDARELERRRTLYLQARDTAIVMVPPRLRDRVAPFWEGASERALAAGTAEITDRGDVRVRRAR